MISAVSGQETKLLLSSDEISKRVSQLGREITQDYKDKDLVIVGVLKGGFIFLADLIRHIELKAEIDFIRVSSYKEGMEARDIELITDTAISLKNRHVLLVEDLIDTCETLDFIKKTIMSKNPASFQICALIKKKKSRETKIAVNYIGFEIDDKFIIGYGTDLAEKGRNLPDIYVIE
ncbi:MAG: hypoxanthine phosphoribosyltransferase [Candidatus Dadabacteria bacterium]|nr:hypoxanthine phosphoribosyltransferase [Candidatus Dadabacteria bacterium]